MNYITLGIIAVFVAFAIFGGLLGCIRGRNRAILRFFLVLVSAAVSILLIDVAVSFVMKIEIEGKPVKEFIATSLSSGESIPESLQNLMFTIVEVILGALVYFVLFGAVLFVTWILVFPILKCFIKQGSNKGVGLGFIVGLLQGVVVAFLVCAPLSGLVTDVGKMTNVTIDGQKAIPAEIPEEVDFEDYNNSTVYKILDKSGNWLYKLVSSSETENGTSISITDTVDVVVALAEISNQADNLAGGLENLSKEGSTAQEKVDGLSQIGSVLIEMDNSINSLGDSGKELLNNLVGEVVSGLTGEEENESINEIIENIDFTDLSLKSTGEALQGLSSYVEKTTEGFSKYGEEVTQTEVSSIVNGLADNSFFIDMFTDENGDVQTAIEISAENQGKFENAISSAQVDEETKNNLRKLFGLI
ncbi:MAG: hypothetical protein J6V66_00475 [Clostridia bacterium]|nr:hypothetical protein [Clostridia bacterium]